MIQITKIEKAIYERLTGDSTLTGLGRVRMAYAGEGTAKPYVVVTVAIDSLDMLFGTNANVANVIVTAEVYVDRSASSAIETAQTMLDRLHGDESTFGLHRWKPTLEGKWIADALHLESVQPIHDENTLAYSMRFLMLQSDTQAPQLISAAFNINTLGLTLTFDRSMGDSSAFDASSLIVRTASANYATWDIDNNTSAGAVVVLTASGSGAASGTANTLDWDGGGEIVSAGGLAWPAITDVPVTVT